MKHSKVGKTTQSNSRRKLNSYDEFDDDYYHDLIEEKNNSLTKRHRPARKNARQERAFNKYDKGY